MRDILSLLLPVLLTMLVVIGAVIGILTTLLVLIRLCSGVYLRQTGRFLLTAWSLILTGTWFIVNKTGAFEGAYGVLSPKAFAVAGLCLIVMGALFFLPSGSLYNRESKAADNALALD